MYSIGNEELNKGERIATGSQIDCPRCGGKHVLTGGINVKTGEPTDSLLVYHCGGKTYLAGIDNKRIP